LDLLLILAPKVREWQVQYSKWNNFMINIFLNRYTELLTTLNEVSFKKMDERLANYLKQYDQRQGADKEPSHTRAWPMNWALPVW